MKRSIIYSFFAALLFFSCRKDDNIKIPDLTRVPLPLVTIDPTSDKVISPVAPNTFKGKVNVDVHFKSDVPPQKFDLVVIKNGNKAKVLTLKEGITSFPTAVDITGTQLATLFGEPLKEQDAFDIGVDITIENGQKFLAFPAVGVPYGTGNFNQPGVSVAVQFLVPCPFVPAAYAGDFEVLADDWNDYKVGTVIPVKVESPTQVSFVYAVDPGSAKPILLTVNPADNSITVAKQAYGTYGGEEYSAVSVAGPVSAVNPCNTSLSVRLTHTTVAGYTFTGTIRLKKK